MKKGYTKAQIFISPLTVGEFCASTCTSKPQGKESWDDIVKDINAQGYRTLETADASAPAMVS